MMRELPVHDFYADGAKPVDMGVCYNTARTSCAPCQIMLPAI